MRIHDLKIDPKPFADLVSGAKTCEVRNDDRGFEVGDTVRFPGGHCCTISHIQRGYGLPDGLCVLSYAEDRAAPEQQQPVAWMVGETVWENRSAAVRNAADRMRLVRPLYTHADDGELERLRAELASLRRWESNVRENSPLLNELEKSRQQLAEAQALLRDWLDDKYTCDEMDGKASAFLSATAQPADGVKS